MNTHNLDFSIPELHDASNHKSYFGSVITRLWTRIALTKLGGSLSTSKIPFLSSSELDEPSEIQDVFKSKSESATLSTKPDAEVPSLVIETSLKSEKDLRATTAEHSLPNINDSDVDNNTVPCSSKHVPLNTPDEENKESKSEKYKSQLHVLRLSELKKRFSKVSDDSAHIWRSGATQDIPQRGIQDDLCLLKNKLQEVFGQDVGVPSVGPEAGKVITSKAYVPALPGYEDFSCSAFYTDVEIADFVMERFKNKAVQVDLTHGVRKDTEGLLWGGEEWLRQRRFNNSELVDYRVPCLTGFFRDQVRRIDLVMVVVDSNNNDQECFKRTYFLNLRNAGLDLEFEPGVLKKNEKLLFVKVHGPHEVILRCARHYDAGKYFKNNHLDFARPSWRHEKEIIKAIRQNYPGPNAFSTFERISLVYRLLLSTRFGPGSTHYGLNKLLDMGIIKDVYPLHDGPYFFLPKPLQEDIYLNGRQALYDQWVGYGNFAKKQPLHTIREYYGERVAFLFAFFEYYNKWMLIPGIVGIATAVMGLVSTDNDFIVKAACTKTPFDFQDLAMDNIWSIWPIKTFNMHYEDLPVCPKCADFAGCPFVNMTNYCKEVRFKTMIDNPYSIFHIMFVVLYFIVFGRMWRRKEGYLYWLWEAREGQARSMLRHDFDYSYDFRFRWIVRSFGLFLVMLLYVFVCMPFLIVLELTLYRRATRYIQNEKNIVFASYMTVVFMGGFNAIVIIIFEHISTKGSLLFSHWLYSHQTEWEYESSFIKHMFGFIVFTNFGLFFYYTFIKGLMYRSPYNYDKWTIPFGLGSTNCGMLSCIDEVFVIFVTTQMFKKSFQEVYVMYYERKHKSEFDRGGWQNQNVPCWEKELDLSPVTEKTIMLKYNWLMLQFMVITFSAHICPMAAIIAYFINIYEMRYWAKKLILQSRRPLLVKTWGLGAWHLVMQLMPYAAALWNIASFVRLSCFLQKKFYRSYFSDLRFFPDYAMSVFYTTSFRRNFVGQNWLLYADQGRFSGDYPHWKQAHLCLYPGMFSIMHKEGFHDIETWERYVPHVKHNFLHWQSVLLIFSFLICVIITGVIINIVLRPISEIVRNSMNVESMLKNARIRRDLLEKKDD